ncbi:efflux RND transporter periplasmic adaptor subunit [Thalassotalea marina]|uniref:RND transporter MFP subunit n=1 Tax=Thalassotalea marina TaxID=1673741 RepID=A0A919BB89_9GAMM|nr:efflux RND transporter periplasmic adaptor subunit [Thalassotalea marina]GHF79144.1 RND transporter MFP subunit [Thalassotalea marina]
MKDFNISRMAYRLLLGVAVALPLTGFSQSNEINAQNTIALALSSSQLSNDTAQEHQHSEDENSANKADKHSPSAGLDTQEQQNKQEDADEEHEEGVSFSQEQMTLADILVKSITPQFHSRFIYAPGEVKANGYKSYIVSPRTDSVVIRRHATLGEHVVQGQVLVTLFSEAMAQAQADYLVASTEWQRVKKLGNSTISESQLLQAETAFNASFGKLIALGMTEQAIGDISIKHSKTLGQYSLIAQRAGVVLQDDFTQGQRVAAGDSVMLLADEQDLWVEAKVAPNKELNISLNSPATVEFAKQKFAAKVIQEAHTIDPQTRTRIVRLSVANESDRLHSGMFVKIYFHFNTQEKVMAVPEGALVRSADGDWTVFVEQHPGEFKAVEVTLGRSLGNNREIFGLEPGSQVVTKGAFFVASQIAKSGFDPHNH